MLFFLFLMTLSPFLLLDVSHFKVEWFSTFFPGRILLTLFVFSGAIILIAHLTERKWSVRMPGIMIILIVLGLQSVNARSSYEYISRNAHFFETSTAEVMNRISRGEKVILEGLPLGYYSNLYAIFEKMGWTNRGWGKLVMAANEENLVVNDNATSGSDFQLVYRMRHDSHKTDLFELVEEKIFLFIIGIDIFDRPKW